MECGFKRKFLYVNEAVDVPMRQDYFDVTMKENDIFNSKKVKLSVQLGAIGSSSDVCSIVSNDQFDSLGGRSSWSWDQKSDLEAESVIVPCDSIMDTEGDAKCSEAVKEAVNRFNSDIRRGEVSLDDIPSTSEVIQSLRKVILWMSAQEDNNTDHIEYLSNVERYAISKQQHLSRQPKITQYLVRQRSH